MKFLILLGYCLCLLSCGVKGDPVPPKDPVHLGAGKPEISPTSTKNIKIKKNFEYDEEGEKNARKKRQ